MKKDVLAVKSWFTSYQKLQTYVFIHENIYLRQPSFSERIDKHIAFKPNLTY